MELIGKQIAIETILGQPPELHYPSWYAAQIEKLPPVPPEYLAEQAGILVTDSDTISRQAAIDFIDVGHLVNPNEPRWSDNEVVNFLKSRPSAQPEPCEDTVSRAKAIDEIKEIYEWHDNVTKERIIEHFKQLPPAQPKRIRGKWVFKNDLIAIPTGYYECSECKIGRLMYKENFCPNCGAEMREVTE